MKPDTDRIVRTLTFWLRPDFVLRVVNRFQRIAGFDRSIALASSALTAFIPLLIFTSGILPHVGGDGAADDIVDRYDLSGEAADVVQEVFSPDAGVSTSIGIFGALFLIVAVLSFTRAVQRLFESTWELPPLSVRNSLNGLKWIGGLLVYGSLTGAIRGLFDRGAAEVAASFVLAPLAAAFLIWTGYLLTAKRVPWRDFLAFGIVASSLLSLYSIGASVYLPRLFETYAERYGVIGVVFAMISALFAAMVVIVGSAVLGREVHDEMGRIRRGERPSEDEVRKQWNEVIAEARVRWGVARQWIEQKRGRGEQPEDGGDGREAQSEGGPDGEAPPDELQSAPGDRIAPG